MSGNSTSTKSITNNNNNNNNNSIKKDKERVKEKEKDVKVKKEKKKFSLSGFIELSRANVPFTDNELVLLEQNLPSNLMDWAGLYDSEGYSVIQLLLSGPSFRKFIDMLKKNYSQEEFVQAFHHVVVPRDVNQKTAFSSCLLFGGTKLLERVIGYLGGKVPVKNAKSYLFSLEAVPEKIKILALKTDFLDDLERSPAKLADYFRELKLKKADRNVLTLLEARPDLWASFSFLKTMFPSFTPLFSPSVPFFSSSTAASSSSAVTAGPSAAASSSFSGSGPSGTVSVRSLAPPAIPTNLKSAVMTPYSEAGYYGSFSSSSLGSPSSPSPSVSLKTAISSFTFSPPIFSSSSPQQQLQQQQQQPFAKSFASVAAAAPSSSILVKNETKPQDLIINNTNNNSDLKDLDVPFKLSRRQQKKMKNAQAQAQAQPAQPVQLDLKEQGNPEQEQKAQQNKLCSVCWTNEPRVAFLPCKHLSTCESCSAPLLKCPLCMTDISDKLLLFV